MTPPASGSVPFNERLDHLQARHPFAYNLVTGAILSGLVVLLFSLHWSLAVLYALSWATIRWYLWRDGHILRRQYEARVVRVAAAREERRRQR